MSVPRRCHMCERPLEHDHDPYAEPGHYAHESWTVAMGNGLYVTACWSCWMRWPDSHKLWPAEGYGRSLERLNGLVAVLRETAP